MSERLTATERQWQQAVIALAHTLGWTVAHFRPAQTVKGWRTPVEADGAGFPDLVLVRERCVFAELKAAKGKPTAAQVEWLDQLAAAGCETYLWQPGDFDEIAEILSARHRPPRNVGSRWIAHVGRYDQ